MHISANNKEGAKNLDIKVLSLIEKANEFQWTAQLLSVALFIDSTLCILTGKNILDYPWDHFQWPKMLGVVLTTAIAYCVLASFVLPATEVFVGQFVRTVYYYFLSHLFFDDKSYKRPKNCVYSSELREHADEKESTYALARYKEWEASANKSNEELFQIGRVSFRTFAFLLASVYYSTPEHPTTIFAIGSHLRSDAFGVSLTGSMLILFALACRTWCRPGYPTNWVTYFPLYNQIEEKRRAELESQREWAQEFSLRGRVRQPDE